MDERRYSFDERVGVLGDVALYLRVGGDYGLEYSVEPGCRGGHVLVNLFAGERRTGHQFFPVFELP